MDGGEPETSGAETQNPRQSIGWGSCAVGSQLRELMDGRVTAGCLAFKADRRASGWHLAPTWRPYLPPETTLARSTLGLGPGLRFCRTGKMRELRAFPGAPLVRSLASRVSLILALTSWPEHSGPNVKA